MTRPRSRQRRKSCARYGVLCRRSIIHSPQSTIWPDILSIHDPKSLMVRRIDQLSAELGFDKERIYSWGFSQAVLSVLWGLEDTGKIENAGLYFVEVLNAIKAK